jgi:hypothetical protein
MFDDKKLEDDSLKKILKQVQEKIACMNEDKDDDSSSHEDDESPEEESAEEAATSDLKSFIEGKEDKEDPLKPKTFRGGAAPAGVSVAIEMTKKKPYKR